MGSTIKAVWLKDSWIMQLVRQITVWAIPVAGKLCRVCLKVINVGQNRISHSLMWVAPGPMRGKQVNIHQHLNPAPYHALYYGEKLHMDQNEKLNRFGVTHILAIDGFGRKLLASLQFWERMPLVSITHLCNPSYWLKDYGNKWGYVDHRTEFVLVVAVQWHRASLWQHHHHVPHYKPCLHQII